MKEDKKAAGLLNEMENSIVRHHAKMVEDYCKSRKSCKSCTFYTGVCILGYFLPANWEIKEVEEKGYEND